MEKNMSILKKIILSTLSVTILAASSAASFAAPAISKASLNVRSGPSAKYKAVDTLYRGERVEVKECVSNGWCYITHSGPDGWVSAKYLRAGTSRPPVQKKPRYTPPTRPQQNPPVSFGFSMNSNGDFSFGVGVGGAPTYPHRPPPPLYSPPQPDVCFYKGKNFTGQQFCVSSGTSRSSLSQRWDNSISSVRISNGASVKICRWEDYRGGCRTIGSSKSHLGDRFNNRISSFKAK